MDFVIWRKVFLICNVSTFQIVFPAHSDISSLAYYSSQFHNSESLLFSKLTVCTAKRLFFFYLIWCFLKFFLQGLRRFVLYIKTFSIFSHGGKRSDIFFVQGIHKNTLFGVVHTKKYIKLEARRGNKLALEKNRKLD